MNPLAISDADVARSRADPRFKQILLARGLEQLLDSLYRLQARSTHLDPDGAHHMREGALAAVRLADLIRAIDDQLARSKRSGFRFESPEDPPAESNAGRVI